MKDDTLFESKKILYEREKIELLQPDYSIAGDKYLYIK